MTVFQQISDDGSEVNHDTLREIVFDDLKPIIGKSKTICPNPQSKLRLLQLIPTNIISMFVKGENVTGKNVKKLRKPKRRESILINIEISGHICLSSSGVELGGSKDCHL